ncbi:integral membrane protein GPR137B isoform X1 [Pitangus sulphuratus]|nr:integral membrane protein GPR137B isoform X1 [Pitangus sulphuratus]
MHSRRKVIFKAKSKYSPELLKYRLPLYLASLFISLLFLLVNLTCAVLVRTQNSERKVIVSVRVAINDTLFVLCAVSLSICLYKISKMSLANIYLESKADLKCQLGDAGYIVFGVILFIWELLPTSLVVYFFRVRNPTKDLANAGMVPSHGFSPRSYFFDNPRRYDSDDDLAWNIAPQGAQGRLLRLEPSEQQLHGLHRIPPTRSSTGHRPAKPYITSINYSIPGHSDIKTNILKNKA